MAYNRITPVIETYTGVDHNTGDYCFICKASIWCVAIEDGCHLVEDGNTLHVSVSSTGHTKLGATKNAARQLKYGSIKFHYSMNAEGPMLNLSHDTIVKPGCVDVISKEAFREIFETPFEQAIERLMLNQIPA